MDNQEHEVEITEKSKRKPFPGWLYGVLFVLFDAIGVGILEWGVTATSRVKLSSPTIGWGFVSKMWTDLNFVAVLNLLLCGIVYLILLMISNRFWVATPIYLALAIIIAVIEHFKITIRYEAVIPSDLSFLKSDAGNLMSFMPSGAQWTILGAVAGIPGVAWTMPVP